MISKCPGQNEHHSQEKPATPLTEGTAGSWAESIQISQYSYSPNLFSEGKREGWTEKDKLVLYWKQFSCNAFLEPHKKEKL